MIVGVQGSTNPQLTADDQTKLRAMLRGPFAKGMREVEAERVLAGVMRWKVKYETR
jgi:hypothetical protein